ncbi:hypothetical protein EMCRGX_G000548 [Ephydatia muelleri]
MDHRIADMCNIAKVHRDAIREALVCAQEVTSKLTRAIDANDKMAEQERKKTLLSEMEAISISKTTALSLLKEQLMKMQDEIGHYTEMTSHILQTHTDHEMAALGDLLPTELKAILKKVENVSLTPNQSSDIHVTLSTDSLIKELSIFAHGLLSGERYPHGGLQVKAELRPKSHDGAVVPGEVEDHGGGTYTITLTPQTAGTHLLLITMDGQHLVIHCSGPSCIAIHDSGDICVACGKNHCIHVFDQAGQQKRTIGSCGIGDGQFNLPYGIFIKGDVLYVVELANHRIQKLTTGGQFLQTFGQCRSGQGQFIFPTFVIVDQRDRLIVSDGGNNRVVILDQAGTCLLTINGYAPGSHAFQISRGLALDPQGNIHVTTSGSNAIKVFTPEGTYVRSYGDVKDPSGIVIDEEGYCLVNDFRGGCLSIFDPQEKKIHTVGNLIDPDGVMLDPKSGSLYVANSGADTVLKYSVL